MTASGYSGIDNAWAEVVGGLRETKLASGVGDWPGRQPANKESPAPRQLAVKLFGLSFALGLILAHVLTFLGFS